MLKDIIFSGITWRDKSRTIDVNYSHGVIVLMKIMTLLMVRY